MTRENNKEVIWDNDEEIVEGGNIDDLYKRKVNSQNWTLSGERCPKCNGRMIINKHGHECGELRCDYNTWEHSATKLKGE